MKILYLANIRLPSEKGQTLQTMKMADAFAQNGVFVELVVPFRFNKTMKHVDNVYEYYNIKNKDKIKITTLYIPDFMPFRGLLGHWAFRLNYWFFARFASLYALIAHSDIIYSREWRVLMFLRKYKNNLMFELHDFREKDIWGYKAISKSCIKIIAITKALKEKLTEVGISENKLEVLPDAVDLDETAIDIGKKDARKELNLPIDKKLFIYTGHLYDWKGIDTLLECWEKLDSDKHMLVLVGGTDEDISRIKTAVFAKNIKNVLVAGYVNYRKIPLYLKSADFLVLSGTNRYKISKEYTSPLKLFQYLSSRVPIIAVNTSAVSEILDSDTAFLYTPDDSDNLKQTVLEADSTSHHKIKRMTDKGYDIAKKHTWQKRAEKIISFSGLE